MNNTDCFIALPYSQNIYATQVSLLNLIKQLNKKDPNANVLVDFLQKEYRLTVRTTKNIKEFKYNENIFTQQEDKMTIQSTKITTKDLVHSLQSIVIWLSRFKHNAKRKVKVQQLDEKLHFTIIHLLPPQTNMQKVEKMILIDGSNLLHRGYFATQVLQAENGLYTNAVFVLTRSILSLIKDYKPSHIAVCWDKSSKTTFRKKLFPDYKAHRTEKDPELQQQFGTAMKLLQQMEIKQFAQDEYEADDLIGTFAAKWTKEKSGDCYMVSNDQDLYQLLNDKVCQLKHEKNNEKTIRLKDFKTSYQITPKQWIDVKALLGDNSDNIPGVKGVGDKAALPLIRQYGNIETLYDHVSELSTGDFKRYYKALIENKEAAFLSKKLATIVTDVPLINAVNLDELKVCVNQKKMLNAFQHLQFDSLIKQFQQGNFLVS